MFNYDEAIICENGHIINCNVHYSKNDNFKYCSDCGGLGISVCKSCAEPIQGAMLSSGIPGAAFYKPPSFCGECGHPHVWTENVLKATEELADLLDWLTEEEREDLKLSVSDIISKKSSTPVAVVKFKRLAKKIGKETMDAFRSILHGQIGEEMEIDIFG